MNVTIIIAAYNEEKHIEHVIKRVQKQGCTNIIVVDDGSKDSTYEKALKTRVTVLKHAVNLGKGAAVRTGCDYAIAQGTDYLVLLDGDGQHEPEEIKRFTKELHTHDIVFGMRKRSKEMPLLYRVGNWGLTLYTRLLFGINIYDSQCGYRAMTADAYKKLRWDANDYGMESEMIARAGKHSLRHKEIIIKTIYHEKYKGTGVGDGIKIAINMLKWRLIL